MLQTKLSYLMESASNVVIILNLAKTGPNVLTLDANSTNILPSMEDVSIVMKDSTVTQRLLGDHAKLKNHVTVSTCSLAMSTESVHSVSSIIFNQQKETVVMIWNVQIINVSDGLVIKVFVKSVMLSNILQLMARHVKVSVMMTMK